MNQTIRAAALAAAFALVAGRVVPAQEPERPMEPGASAMQEDHLTEAVKQTQAAIDAGNSGQKNLVVEHAQEALTHAEAAEKEHHSPKIEAAIHYLERGGGEAIVTNPENVERALAGETGTHIVPD